MPGYLGFKSDPTSVFAASGMAVIATVIFEIGRAWLAAGEWSAVGVLGVTAGSLGRLSVFLVVAFLVTASIMAAFVEPISRRALRMALLFSALTVALSVLTATLVSVIAAPLLGDKTYARGEDSAGAMMVFGYIGALASVFVARKGTRWLLDGIA